MCISIAVSALAQQPIEMRTVNQQLMSFSDICLLYPIRTQGGSFKPNQQRKGIILLLEERVQLIAVGARVQ